MFAFVNMVTFVFTVMEYENMTMVYRSVRELKSLPMKNILQNTVYLVS